MVELKDPRPVIPARLTEIQAPRPGLDRPQRGRQAMSGSDCNFFSVAISASTIKKMARREFDQILRAGKINRTESSLNTSRDSDHNDESPSRKTIDKVSSTLRAGNSKGCARDKSPIPDLGASSSCDDHRNSTETCSPERVKFISTFVKDDTQRNLLLDKISTLQSEIVDFKEELHESRNQSRDLTSKLSTQNSFTEKQKREIEMLRNRNMECQAKCNHLSEQILLIKSERDDLQAELQDVASNYSGKRCTLTDSLIRERIITNWA